MSKPIPLPEDTDAMTALVDPAPRALIGSQRPGRSAALITSAVIGVPASFVLVSLAASLTFPGNTVAITAITGLIVILYSLIARYYIQRYLRSHLTDSADERDQPAGVLGVHHPQARTVLVVALALLTGWYTAQLAGAITYGYFGSPGFDAYTETVAAPPVWQMALLALVLAPISEELLLRGVAYPLLRTRCSVWVSITLTTIIFGLIHANLVQFIATMPLAIIAALIYEHTRHLGYAIGAHVLFNVLSLVMPVAVVNIIGAAGMPTTIAVTVIFAVLTTWLMLQARTLHAITPEKKEGEGEQPPTM